MRQRSGGDIVMGGIKDRNASPSPSREVLEPEVALSVDKGSGKTFCPWASVSASVKWSDYSSRMWDLY